jgi:AcrR family transcriptional regulator
MAKSPTRVRRYAPRMPPEERREQLLGATLVLVTEEGFEGVSMEGIARRAGVTKPVVYDLFGSLPELLEALLDREGERALIQLAELMSPCVDDADPAKALVEGLDALLRAIEARPDSWRLILMPTEAMPASLRGRVERDGDAVAARLESIARAGANGIDVPASDAEMLVETIVLFMQAAGRRYLADPQRYSRHRITEFAGGLAGGDR